MKKIKYIFAIILCLLLCGCVRSNTSMVINKDKSMSITLDLMLNEYSRKNYGDLLNKRTDELKKNGFTIKTISEEFYGGYSITKKYKNIDDTIYEGKDSVDISKFTDDKFNDKIFTVKKGLFYNTYYANFEFDSLLSKYNNVIESIEKKAETGDEESETKEEINFSGAEYTFSVSFPDRPMTSNATKISKDGKTLTWKLNQAENSSVKFSFKMINKLIVVIAISLGAIVFAIIIYILVKKIKKKRSISSDIKRDKPILKEYDPSIENQINKPRMSENIPVEEVPVNPANNIGVSAQPIFEIKTEQKNTNQTIQPLASIKEKLSNIDLSREPFFNKKDEKPVNTVGMSAQPIFETRPEPIVEVKEEPLVVEKPIIEESKPEVSTANLDAMRLNNYEIKLPEETLARQQFKEPEPAKKEPKFINTAINDEEKPAEQQYFKQDVVIDKPDAIDINSIL